MFLFTHWVSICFMLERVPRKHTPLWGHEISKDLRMRGKDVDRVTRTCYWQTRDHGQTLVWTSSAISKYLSDGQIPISGRSQEIRNHILRRRFLKESSLPFSFRWDYERVSGTRTMSLFHSRLFVSQWFGDRGTVVCLSPGTNQQVLTVFSLFGVKTVLPCDLQYNPPFAPHSTTGGDQDRPFDRVHSPYQWRCNQDS